MPDEGLNIPIRVDASGVPPGVAQTEQGLKRVEAATDQAAQAAREMGQASTTAANQSAAAADANAGSATTAAKATENLGTITGSTALRLATLRITQDEVRTSAVAVGGSLEATARAMIQMRDVKLSDEIARVREQLEELQSQGNEATAPLAEGTQQSTTNVEDLSSTLEFMGDDLTDNAEKGHKMVEELGSMRESRRLAIELFESFSGGGETIAGVTGILRTFLLTTEALNPVAAAVAAIGLALAGVYALHGQKEDGKKDLEDYGASIKDLEKQAKESYGNMLEMLKEQTAEYRAQVDAVKELQRAKDELQDAQLAGKIANLDEQEQKDLAGKSEGEQAAIERDYEKKRIELRQQQAVEKANDDLAAKQQAAKDAEKAIQDQKNLAEAEQLKLSQAYGVVQGGAAAGVKGIKSDAQVAQAQLDQLDYNFYNGSRALTPEETLQREDLQKKVPELQQKEAVSGPDFTEGLKQLQTELQESRDREKDDLNEYGHIGWDGARIGAAHDAADGERANQEKIKNAIDAINNYSTQMQAAQDVIKESVPKFQELNRSIPTLQTKADTANTEVAAAQQKVTNTETSARVDTDKLTAQQARQIAKEEFDKREAQRASSSAEMQAELKNPNLNEAQKAQLQNKIEGLKTYTDQDQLDHSKDLGLSDADIIKLKGNQVSTRTSTANQIAAEKQKAEAEAARKQAQQTKADQRGAGQEALSEIEGLGGSKQIVDQAKTAVSEMDKGHQAGAAELLGILDKLSGTVKNLTQGQATAINRIMERLREIDRELESHGNSLQSLVNGNNN
jgi:hypothetical protein